MTWNTTIRCDNYNMIRDFNVKALTPSIEEKKGHALGARDDFLGRHHLGGAFVDEPSESDDLHACAPARPLHAPDSPRDSDVARHRLLAGGAHLCGEHSPHARRAALERLLRALSRGVKLPGTMLRGRSARSRA